MTNLENTLWGIFSAESGLDDDFIAELVQREKSNLSLRVELIEAFNNPEFDWISLLHSKYAFVADVSSNEEGKQYVIDILWKPLFPDEDPHTAV